MAEKDDLDIIEALVDANCRAHNEEFGFHYDSRCLEHYNAAIGRLIEAGRVNHHGVSAKGGAAKPFVDPKLRGPVIGEEEGGQVQPRIRSTYVPVEKQVVKPTTDPLWMMWQKENARLRQEVEDLKNKPETPASEPEIDPPTDPVA